MFGETGVIPVRARRRDVHKSKNLTRPEPYGNGEAVIGRTEKTDFWYEVEISRQQNLIFIIASANSLRKLNIKGDYKV